MALAVLNVSAKPLRRTFVLNCSERKEGSTPSLRASTMPMPICMTMTKNNPAPSSSMKAGTIATTKAMDATSMILRRPTRSDNQPVNSTLKMYAKSVTDAAMKESVLFCPSSSLR